MHELALFLLQSQHDQEMVQKILMMAIPIMMVVYLVIVALVMIPCWFILKKAGFSPWLSLLCIMPSLGALVLLYILAFAEWKVVPAPRLAWPPPPAIPPQPPLPPHA